MNRIVKTVIFALGVMSVTPPLFAEGETDLVVTQPTTPISTERGMAAWDRIYAVASHPRCANCHVDARNIPIWTDDATGMDRVHGMHINAGESRLGAEGLMCATCHMTSTRPNTIEHAPPHAGIPWQLAPVEFLWHGQSSVNICEQMRNADRNGGRDGAGLVEHILHDVSLGGFIAWGFNPGAGREPAPGTLQEHLDDMITWTAAGMPCPND
ncbi:hypothetical protein BFP76_02400 [Amylibacter kogurei]|uniref:Uncharacterized protein n=1 Tax=Paramylibacter kogurei TaxID=1889778 RepID=A0A2G5K3M1_9RHOB|nr:hypothetical protein [Amylibacter kogurei]PIB24111.1 hypothetical protein BFP76_02400 [Amylibacter kogurei]